jgi:hypothetical protein
VIADLVRGAREFALRGLVARGVRDRQRGDVLTVLLELRLDEAVLLLGEDAAIPVRAVRGEKALSLLPSTLGGAPGAAVTVAVAAVSHLRRLLFFARGGREEQPRRDERENLECLHGARRYHEARPGTTSIGPVPSRAALFLHRSIAVRCPPDAPRPR